jgi:aminoglycoside 3-N-acetyltransferase
MKGIEEPAFGKLNESDKLRIEAERTRILHCSEPVTVKEMKESLHRLGVKTGMTLLPHISLSSIGWVCGGVQAILQTLMGSVGQEGNLLFPSYTGYNTDPATWKYPPVPESWWEAIRQHLPAYEKKMSPPSGMGKVVEGFRSARGVKRSNHPRSSFLAWGRNSSYLVSYTGYDFPFGDNGPLGRAYELDAQILMIGVNYTIINSLYLAYFLAEIEKPVEICRSAVMKKGKRQWVTYKDYPRNTRLFQDICESFIRGGKSQQCLLGKANCLLISQRQLVDYARRCLEERQADLRERND